MSVQEISGPDTETTPPRPLTLEEVRAEQSAVRKAQRAATEALRQLRSRSTHLERLERRLAMRPVLGFKRRLTDRLARALKGKPAWTETYVTFKSGMIEVWVKVYSRRLPAKEGDLGASKLSRSKLVATLSWHAEERALPELIDQLPFMVKAVVAVADQVAQP